MNTNRLFVVIRVPKSGSRTLRHIMQAALPNAAIHPLPNPSKPDAGISFIENARVVRGRLRRRWKRHGVVNEEMTWTRIADKARTGDIVIGHIGIADLKLPGFELDHITLIRDPVNRLMSEYFYSKRGFQKRPLIRKLYNWGRLRAAARLSFSDYIAFLHERQDLYANRTTKFVTGQKSCDDPETFLLENYFHFGTLEKIDKFAEGLAQKVGTSFAVPHHNKSANREEVVLTSADRTRLEDLCGEDIRLHATAARLVDAGLTGRSW